MSLHGILSSSSFVALSLVLVIIFSPSACEWLVSPLLPASTLGKQVPLGDTHSMEARLAAALQETADLRRLLRDLGDLSVSSDGTPGTMVCRVLGSDPKLLATDYILDKGTSQGVSPDSVATKAGCLVGFVTETRPNWCLLSPLHNPEQHWIVDIVALDGRPSPAEGWPRGVGSGRALPGGRTSVEVFHVPVTRVAEIRIGDAVVTTGTDFRCPKGLLAGHVAEVRREDLFLRIAVKISMDPATVPIVLLQPPPPNPFRKAEKRR